ncbi:MAG: ferritin family protein [Chloroflexi bacterium]|nr:ferritin family protein [Chloroflexota bacterium]
MEDEFKELLDTAMYKEIASQAVYEAAQNQTIDPGAKVLMKELADEEAHHLQILRDFKQSDLESTEWDKEKISNLMISEYLTGGDTLDGANIQETLTFAMKREQEAVEFYSRMISALRSESAKRLCKNLVQAEQKHKSKLELLYDDLFYQED